MDKTISAIIGTLKDAESEQLQSLGKLPKADPFEHGVEVGIYRGLQKALERLEYVLKDEAESEARR